MFNTKTRAFLNRVEGIQENADLGLDSNQKNRQPIDPLGGLLLSKVEEIRIRVDAEIARNEPDPISYQSALNGILAGVPGLVTSTGEQSMVLGGETDPRYRYISQFRFRG